MQPWFRAHRRRASIKSNGMPAALPAVSIFAVLSQPKELGNRKNLFYLGSKQSRVWLMLIFLLFRVRNRFFGTTIPFIFPENFLHSAMDKQQTIYLDYAATTPLDSRVFRAMQPYFTDYHGNSSSVHGFGRRMLDAVEAARNELAQIIHARPSEIVFTASATEANNLALKGVAEAHASKGKHIIISSIEHASVYETGRYLEKRGFEISWIPVQANGRIHIQALEEMVRPDTILISVMHVNNELGTIQDLEAVGNLCRERKVLFHSDAAQGFAKLPIHVQKMKLDLLTVASHKIYGPVGAGFLFIRSGTKLNVQMHGGGHEDGRRASTVNVPAVVGLAAAARIYVQEGVKEQERIARIRSLFLSKIEHAEPNVVVNGDREEGLPNILNLSFPGCDAELLAMQLDRAGVAVSTGSACSGGTVRISRVLKACGIDAKQGKGAVRFSFGRFTTEEEIERVTELLPGLIRQNRQL